MELGEIINTDFPFATMADIDVFPPTGIGVRYRKIVTLSDDVSLVLVYNMGTEAHWLSKRPWSLRKWGLKPNAAIYTQVQYYCLHYLTLTSMT